MELQRIEAPKGSYVAGRRVRLPRGAREPLRVHVNGVEQVRGTDYELRDRAIVFARPMLKEQVGMGRWMAMYLGLFGTYRKHDTVDVEYHRDGKVQLASDLPIEPDN